MTYGELSKTKTFGFETNHIIDDAVNNARFSYGKKFWESEVVSDHDMNQISHFAKREGITFPLAVPIIANACRNCGTNGEHYCPADVATD